MIDMENKTIYFGYGDVIINIDICANSIRFIEINSPVELNISVSKEIINQTATGSIITIELSTIGSFADFKNAIKTINGKDCLQCTYNDYILDFSNYNQKCIEAILTQLEKLLLSIIIPMSC